MGVYTNHTTMALHVYFTQVFINMLLPENNLHEMTEFNFFLVKVNHSNKISTLLQNWFKVIPSIVLRIPTAHNFTRD